MNQSKRTSNLAWGLIASIIIMITMLSSLIYYAPAWDFVANTRLLSLLINSGLVQYHDMDAGFIEGIADLKLYLLAKDPIRWSTVGLLVGCFFLCFWLRIVQFGILSRHFGYTFKQGNASRHVATGLLNNLYLPFRMESHAIRHSLETDGATEEQASSIALGRSLLLWLEILIFALIALFILGWSAWLGYLWWGLVIFGVCYFVTRPSVEVRHEIRTRSKEIIRGMLDQPSRTIGMMLLSMACFLLEDIAAYFTAMAFTSDNVILHIDPTVLLMALIAGALARQLPVTPGGIGQFEWAFAATLWMSGTAFHECVTIAVLDNLFRYLSYSSFSFMTLLNQRKSLDVRKVLGRFKSPETESNHQHFIKLDSGKLWGRLLIVSLAFCGLFFIDQLSFLAFDYWLLESLGLESVFNTNFWMGTVLFFVGSILLSLGILIPAFNNPLAAHQRKFVIGLAVLIGSISGYFLSLKYQTFLFYGGIPFGETDPIFNRDVGFYIYDVPVMSNRSQIG